jgi:isopentenyl-diphosphate delta-isomerase
VQEEIILVNDQGEIIGSAPKLESHHADTPLHLAFSCYVFRKDGKFLLTRRALSKKVWPGVWTNSVCGHPAPGEKMEDAIMRRLDFELGVKKIRDLKVILPDYRYKTPPFEGIIENEICPVYIAYTDQEPQPNPDEVESYEWIDWAKLRRAIKKNPDQYSYWFKDQLKKLPL